MPSIRKFVAVLFVTFILSLCPSLVFAEKPIPVAECVSPVLLATAPLGLTNGGLSIYADATGFAFLGARFTLDATTQITGVGGHVKSYPPGDLPVDDRTLFVAIVALDSADGLPDLALSRAVYAAVFEAPYNNVGPYPYQVPETILEPDRLVLAPGSYAIVIGSGLFGATGVGLMPVAPYALGTPDFILANTGSAAWYKAPSDLVPVRFVVEGVPVKHDKKEKK
jgi:hypothetical protein